MKSSFLFFLVLASVNVNLALAATETPVAEANIHKGNWSAGGSFSMIKNSGIRSDSTEISVSVSPLYFVIDHLALGGRFGLDYESEQDTVASLGPAADYYFWESGKLAADVGAGIRFGLTDATLNSISFAFVGLNYFVTPSVAFGPDLFFNHYNGDTRSYDLYGISLGFSVYL